MSQCSICDKQKNDKPTTNTVVYNDEHWVVRHSHETNILGYFVLESRRHIANLADACEEEAMTYGKVLKELQDAMRQVVDCKQIYTWSLGESVPHLHVHVIPRRPDLARGFVGRGIMQYPVVPAADPALMEEVCERVRRAMIRTSRQPAATGMRK